MSNGYEKESYVKHDAYHASKVLDFQRKHQTLTAVERWGKYVTGKIVDVGANYGGITMIIAERESVESAVAVDIFPGVRKRYKDVLATINPEVAKKMSLLIANVLDLHEHFEEESVDTVACFHTLEHFYEDDVPEAIRQMVGIIKSGGHLIVAVPNERAHNDKTHETYWTLERLITTVEVCGSVKHVDSYVDEHSCINALFAKEN